MKITELSCNQAYMLASVRCQQPVFEKILLRTGWVELEPDNSMALCADGKKYRFWLEDPAQREKAYELLRRGSVCLAQKLNQFSNRPLFTLCMVFFKGRGKEQPLEIVLEQQVLDSLQREYPQKNVTLADLLTFRLEEKTFYACAVREPWKEKAGQTRDAQQTDPESAVMERVFQIYGKDCALQVRMASDGDGEDLSGQKLIRHPVGIPALQLTEGELKFGDQRLRVAPGVREQLRSRQGYLDLWDQYAELEGELLLRRAREIDILRPDPDSRINLDDEGRVILFLAKENREALEQLAKDDCLAFTKEEPPYLKDKSLTWKAYKEQKNIRTSEQGTSESRWEITLKISGIDRDACRLALSSTDDSDEAASVDLSGRVISLSIRGDKEQIDRREKSRSRILNGEAANPNIGRVIEGIPYLDRDFARNLPHIAPLSRRVLEKVFSRNPPTQNQKKAIEIAMNTPDIAIIQGPPGTGKTTVIVGLLERLNEVEGKDRILQGEILVSCLQHDAVFNIQERLKINSLPTVKFGKRSGKNGQEDGELNESVEQWRREHVELLRRKNPTLQESDAEKELHQAYSRYLRTPDNQNALKFLQCVELAVPQEEILAKAREIRQVLQPKEMLEAGETNQLIHLIRRLRTTPAGFADDGPQTARALQRFLERNDILEKDHPILQHLRSARNLAADAASPEFLAMLAADRDTLLEKNIPEPYYSRPEPRTDIVALYNLARAQVKPTRNAEERILAEYLDQMEENPEAVRETLKKYCTVFSATLQQSEGREIRIAKGVRKGELPQYNTVVVDEAARANPCDLMIPMAQARRRVILVGDHRQLPHIYDEDVFRELKRTREVNDTANIEKSMFEYLLEKVKLLEKKDGICRHITLDAQYRMHPELGEFVSDQFYRPYGEGFASPLGAEHFVQSISRKPLCWLNVPKELGTEERASGGQSRYRMCEVELIVQKLEENLADEACAELKFGVISFYRAQADAILKKAQQSERLSEALKNKRLCVGTVDAFQGMEFDVIYLSVVRTEPRFSSENHGKLLAAAAVVHAEGRSSQSEECRRAREEIESIGRTGFGFITSENRLCVALSRQKRLLIVVGCSALFGTERDGTFVPGPEAEICVPAMVRLYEKCREKGVVQECRK